MRRARRSLEKRIFWAEGRCILGDSLVYLSQRGVDEEEEIYDGDEDDEEDWERGIISKFVAMGGRRLFAKKAIMSGCYGCRGREKKYFKMLLDRHKL